jgi:hypothetical protein
MYNCLKNQREELNKEIPCGKSQTCDYYIHFHNGASHWSSYSWGWQCSSLKGEEGICGSGKYGGIGICTDCKKAKSEKMNEMFEKFNQEITEKHNDESQEIIKGGRSIGITYYNRN